MNTISDDALRSARERLLARGAELRERVRRIESDLRRSAAPLPRDAPDAAIVLENDEILQAIDETARRELHLIDHALERLDVGTFAICEMCGEPIEAERRHIVPYATYCRECAKDA